MVGSELGPLDPPRPEPELPEPELPEPELPEPELPEPELPDPELPEPELPEPELPDPELPEWPWPEPGPLESVSSSPLRRLSSPSPGPLRSSPPPHSSATRVATGSVPTPHGIRPKRAGGVIDVRPARTAWRARLSNWRTAPPVAPSSAAISS